MRKPTVLTIGKFDGLHLGHQALLGKVREKAEELRGSFSGEVLTAAISFDMAPAMILSKEERRRMFAEKGVDLLAEIPFRADLIAMPPEAFIEEILVKLFCVRAVVVGEGFRFGYQRRGDEALLREAGERYGFSVIPLPAVLYKGERVSSSRIRGDLAAGRIEDAGACLGYPFPITGEIIHGRRLGRTIGVPTANLIADPSKLMPPNGVYFSLSEVNGRIYEGVTNVGTKPTVDGQFVGVETCFFDCDSDLYGCPLCVELLHFERPEKKFASLRELKAQIERDEQAARAYFAAGKAHTGT